MKNRLFIIDSYALIYRAFFAFNTRPLVYEGQNISAVFGFFNSIFNLILSEKPTHLIAVFDPKGKTFRHEVYKEYKATRQKMPEELKSQLAILDRVLSYTNIERLTIDNYEADDIIGSLCEKFKSDKNLDIFIYSADKDLAQLVSENVFLYDPQKSIIFDREKVYDKFKVYPEQIADYLSLMGDSSDNVPGVPKIGKKTAEVLLGEFGSLANILENTDKVAKKSIRNSLLENYNLALLSKELVSLKLDLDLGLELEDLKLKEFSYEPLLNELNKYKLKHLIQVVMTKFGKNQKSNFKEETNVYSKDKQQYQLLKSKEELEAILAEEEFLKAEKISLLPFSFKSDLKGFSFAIKENSSYAILFDLFDFGVSEQMELFNSGFNAKPLLEFFLNKIEGKLIVAHDFKRLKKEFRELKNYLKNDFFDILIADFILRSTNRLEIARQAYHYLNYHCFKEDDIFKKSGRIKAYSDINKEDLALLINEKADLNLKLYAIIDQKLREQKDLLKLYLDIEKPLINLLFKMEENGIYIDKDELEIVKLKISEELNLLRQKIFGITEEEFNIDSNKQLGHILFEKMGLPHKKKLKSGIYSTDSATIEKLLYDGYEIASLLLEYKEKQKLYTTYLEGLKVHIEDDGRIHSDFRQDVTSTGRLSSRDPNLQNIPIRKDSSDQIRALFKAPQGYKIVSFDYSQIELRVLAHFTKDENLIKAFKNGDDIHAITASIIFNEELENVTREQRAKAKIANFSVLYGKGKFSLSKDLGISYQEASSFIDDYFLKFSKIKNYIEETEKEVRSTGMVKTLFNRRRIIDEIYSGNKNVQNSAIRQAVNTPIQGTAADIIKIAMIKAMKVSSKYDAKIILQIHDELLFEVKEGDAEDFCTEVKAIMEAAVDLNVPLVVNIGIANNWYEAH